LAEELLNVRQWVCEMVLMAHRQMLQQWFLLCVLLLATGTLRAHRCGTWDGRMGVLLVAWLVVSLAAGAGSARAAESPTSPILCLETGMHTAPIRRIGVDAANRYLVTGSADKTVRVWELATGRLLRTLRPPINVNKEGRVDAVALSPDGRTVAAAGRTGAAWDGSFSIYLFDRESGRLLRRLTGLPQVIVHLAYSRDGAFLVAALGGANGIRLYRTQDYTQVAGDMAYGGDSNGADFDAAGRLVTASLDGFVRLYDRGGKLRSKRKAPGGALTYGVAFSPDSTRVAVGYADSTRVDVLSGKDLAPLYAPDTSGVGNGTLGSVAWSADGRWLYAGGGIRPSWGPSPSAAGPRAVKGPFRTCQPRRTPSGTSCPWRRAA
jgi:WD domain, G-beta repeat